MGRIARPPALAPTTTPREPPTDPSWRAINSESEAVTNARRPNQPSRGSPPSLPPFPTPTATDPLNVSTFERQTIPSPQPTARPCPKRTAPNTWCPTERSAIGTRQQRDTPDRIVTYPRNLRRCPINSRVLASHHGRHIKVHDRPCRRLCPGGSPRSSAYFPTSPARYRGSVALG